MGTTAHNFETLLKGANEKTCIINQSLETGNRICCAVVGFNSDEKLESAFHTKPIFGSVKLSWTSSLGLSSSSPFVPICNVSLSDYLASLECSLELLTDQISGITCKLNDMKLVSLISILFPLVLAVLKATNLDLGSNMILDGPKIVEEIPDWVISMKLLFKGKQSVMILDLYAGVSAKVRFSQTLDVNSSIVKVVNTNTFVVLGGNFNEDSAKKSTSFKFCLNLRLVNSFHKHSLVKVLTWSNFRSIKKVINFIFVNQDMASAIADHRVFSVSKFFDTNYKTVSIAIGLGGLLNFHLSVEQRQANRDRWKFRIKDASTDK
ncbi:hypothetical protein G9A89_005936 [Geosiphon pyriformis]|nr:hypothetical protein G9A89_005936 [Geosiphon pyriformis]